MTQSYQPDHSLSIRLVEKIICFLKIVDYPMSFLCIFSKEKSLECQKGIYESQKWFNPIIWFSNHIADKVPLNQSPQYLTCYIYFIFFILWMIISMIGTRDIIQFTFTQVLCFILKILCYNWIRSISIVDVKSLIVKHQDQLYMAKTMCLIREAFNKKFKKCKK